MSRNFVCGWTNIKGKTSYAGSSNTHMPSNAAMTVTNCAGHHNVQMFFMTPDGKVLHCLPGYWKPHHFLHEAELAVKLGNLYAKKRLTAVKRNELYLNLHLEHALEHDEELRQSSRHQGFDAADLAKRKESDFKREEGFVTGKLKTPDQVMHERMAELAFMSLEDFDVKSYIDMGLKRYKYDYGLKEKAHGSEKK